MSMIRMLVTVTLIKKCSTTTVVHNHDDPAATAAQFSTTTSIRHRRLVVERGLRLGGAPTSQWDGARTRWDTGVTTHAGWMWRATASHARSCFTMGADLMDDAGWV
jgi:hypothetical protein